MWMTPQGSDRASNPQVATLKTIIAKGTGLTRMKTKTTSWTRMATKIFMSITAARKDASVGKTGCGWPPGSAADWVGFPLVLHGCTYVSVCRVCEDLLYVLAARLHLVA